MTNVTNLFPEKVDGQKVIVEFLQNQEFDDILVLAKKDDVPYILHTANTLEGIVCAMEEIKISLLLGDTVDV